MSWNKSEHIQRGFISAQKSPLILHYNNSRSIPSTRRHIRPIRRESLPLLLALNSFCLTLELFRTTPYSHYQYGHYAQTGYTHYPQYAQQAHQQTASQATQSQTQYQTPQTHQTAAASVIRPAAQPAQTQSTVDTTDVATLNDALGSAGVDLKVCLCTCHILPTSPTLACS